MHDPAELETAEAALATAAFAFALALDAFTDDEISSYVSTTAAAGLERLASVIRDRMGGDAEDWD